MKLSNAVQGFLLHKKLEFSHTTVPSYQWALDHLIDFLGDVEVSGITTADLRLLFDHLLTEHKLSRRSIKDIWARLSSFWTWAEAELEVKHVIKGKIKQPSYTKKKVIPLTEAEIKAILVATWYNKEWETRNGRKVKSKRPTALRDRAIILTLLDTGARASELCSLTIDDYDKKRGRILIQHGKRDKERIVTIGLRTQKALWRYLADRTDGKPSAPLFATNEGYHLKRDNLYRIVVTIGKNAGVKHVHPHRYRHTFAITFLRNGGNVPLLKELLGHEKIEMVLEYARIAEIDIDAAVKFSVADNWRI